MGVPIDLYKVSGRRRYLDCPEWLKLKLEGDMQKANVLQNNMNTFRFHPLGWKLVLNNCVPMGDSQLSACRGMYWVSIAKGQLTVWEGGIVREVDLPFDDIPSCVDCRRTGEALYVALGMQDGVHIVRFAPDGEETWHSVTRGKCLALDVAMAPRYTVCLIEKEGVLVAGRGGVFRLSEASAAGTEPVDVMVPQVAMGSRHGGVFDSCLEDFDHMLSLEERVLSTKCIPCGVLLQTNIRLVSVQNGELRTISYGSPCFCYDGAYLYAAEQHLYGTCFTVYEYTEREWCNVGYYDIRANFGIRKVMGLNVSDTRVELLGEGNELYVFDIQPASYEQA
ncbi:YIG1 (YPL201C) [Zygosaccharomyces parabailii]|nr:YIG1 (YPL201C) [Zygosaccharomyces parabailii]